MDVNVIYTRRLTSLRGTLSDVSGVLEVFSTLHQDGSGSIAVETKDGTDIEVRQRLTTMGYVRGQH